MLEEFKTDEILITHANETITKTFMAKMGDSSGRVLQVQVTNEGEIVDMTGYNVYLLWSHESGNHKGIETFNAVDATQGIFSIEYPATMLNHSGVLQAYIQVVSPENTIINTLNFRIYVQSDNEVMGDTEAADLYETFKQLMANFEEMMNASGLKILGYYESEAQLKEEHPTGAVGDAYIVGTDLYIWQGSEWVNTGRIKGEKGDQGEQGVQGVQGEDGKAATIEVGTVTTGEAGSQAVVNNSGTTSAAILDFTIPKGDKGDKGDTGSAATIDAVTVTTGEPNTQATVENTGTATNARLHFTIPRGDKGETGDGGVPAEGETGQVLIKTETGAEWADAPETGLPLSGGTLTGNVAVNTGTAEPNVTLNRTVDGSPCELTARIDSEAKAGLRYKVSGSTVNELILEQTQTRLRKPLNAASGGVPMDGAEGQVLTKNASGHAWSDLPAIVEPTADRLREILNTPVIEAVEGKAVLKTPDASETAILDIVGGGTGAETAEQALENLGAAPTSHTHEINSVNGLQGALDGKANSSHEHSAADITSGTLGADRLPDIPVDKLNGIIQSDNLPSYVDDVVEGTLGTFPETGESGKIYIDTQTNLSYRWGGSDYVEIASGLALGETSSTAYRGDRGKIAYDHSQTTGNPHNTAFADVAPTGGNSGQVLTKTDNGYEWQDAKGGGSDEPIQAGIIYPFAGSAVPNGFLLCDGQAVSRTTYSELFNVIGTTYGEGDGSTTFNLPDLSGRFGVGSSDSYALGSVGGEAEHTLTVDEMPQHNHSASTSSAGAHAHSARYKSFAMSQSSAGYAVLRRNQSGDGYDGTNTNAALSAGSHTHTVTVNNSGGGQAHNNMPPYISLNYIISTGKENVQAVAKAVSGGVENIEISNVNGLQSALDNKANATHTHTTNDVSNMYSGFAEHAAMEAYNVFTLTVSNLDFDPRNAKIFLADMSAATNPGEKCSQVAVCNMTENSFQIMGYAGTGAIKIGWTAIV